MFSQGRSLKRTSNMSTQETWRNMKTRAFVQIVCICIIALIAATKEFIRCVHCSSIIIGIITHTSSSRNSCFPNISEWWWHVFGLFFFVTFCLHHAIDGLVQWLFSCKVPGIAHMTPIWGVFYMNLIPNLWNWGVVSMSGACLSSYALVFHENNKIQIRPSFLYSTIVLHLWHGWCSRPCAFTRHTLTWARFAFLRRLWGEGLWFPIVCFTDRAL